MPAARVISVHRRVEADLLIGGERGRSVIDKRPVTRPAAVSTRHVLARSAGDR